MFPLLSLGLLNLSQSQGDLGNGQYRNPVLFADYSDPDVIRVRNEYFLVASSFHFMPGVPILRSRDLVNWTAVGHVYPRLDIAPEYDMRGGDRYGSGAWAPSIRYHAGKFFVYFPTPNEGIFVSTARRAEGPWTKPVAVIRQSGLEDPCPFWDDDGQAYLVHSRLGAGPLILHRMSSDGLRVLDEGKTIVEDPKNLPVLEGPKFYKRNGYYYIFAPIGGVSSGTQAILRSKRIDGPYEYRIALGQGKTEINGPHQGGYVETPDGRGWFMHFQSRGAYGRIVHLQPVTWADDWPEIGRNGEPVETWAKPVPGPVRTPQTSDEFGSRKLGPQWEWNHNPDDAHWSLTERKGYLRLKAMPAADLRHARNTLTEPMQHPSFELTARIDVSGLKNGGRAGLTIFSDKASGVGLVARSGRRDLTFFSEDGEKGGAELTGTVVQLRVQVSAERATYAYSLDEGKTFLSVGDPTAIHFAWWKAARPAIYCYTVDGATPSAIDVDWVRYRPMVP